jgi:MOSC domain-containing protein YiiM
MEGRVEAVCLGSHKGRPKKQQEFIELRVGHGVVGDAHAGTDKEVSLLAHEDLDRFMEETGLEAPPGSFAENIGTRGIALVDLPLGARLEVGGAEIAVVARGKDPSRKHTYAYKGHSFLPTRGVFARVIRNGTVRPGDIIRISAPV